MTIKIPDEWVERAAATQYECDGLNGKAFADVRPRVRDMYLADARAVLAAVMKDCHWGQPQRVWAEDVKDWVLVRPLFVPVTTEETS